MDKDTGKRADKKPVTDAGKAVDKPQPEKKQAGEPKDEAAGKDAGKDANKESAPVGAKGKDVKPEIPGLFFIYFIHPLLP